MEYELLPAVFDEYEAMKPGAPQLYDYLPGNLLPLGEPFFGDTSAKDIVIGDCAKGFAEADVVVEASYGYDTVANPIPAESPIAVAIWDGPDKLTMWVSNQTLWLNKVILQPDFRRQGRGQGDRRRLRRQLRVEGHVLAGAMPCRSLEQGDRQAGQGRFFEGGAPWRFRPSARHAARREGRHEKGRDGNRGRGLRGLSAPATTRMTTQAQVAVGCGEAMIAVRCKNWNLKPKIVCTNRNASGIVQGLRRPGAEVRPFSPSEPRHGKALPRSLRIAQEEFRQAGRRVFLAGRHLVRLQGRRLLPAMDKGAQAFGWKEKWKGWLEPTSVNGAKRTGVGVGVHGNADIGEDSRRPMCVSIRTARRCIHSCLSEHGTGQRSNAIKCVAEVLQMPLDQISSPRATP